MDTAVENNEILSKDLLRLFLAAMLFVVVAAAVLLFVIYGGMYIYASAELGTGCPPATAFMRSGQEAEYAETPDVSLHEEGVYRLKLCPGNRTRSVFLIVRDTKAPTAEDAGLYIGVSDAVAPADAVCEVKDASAVTVSWVTAPPFGTPGYHDCEVELRDAYGNLSRAAVTVGIDPLVESLDCELGSELPDAGDFAMTEYKSARFITDLDTIDCTGPCEHEIEIELDGNVFTSVLRFVDTTPPKIVGISAAAAVGDTVEPELFILRCEDMTEVSYSFVKAPPCDALGEHPCVIRATDECGNYTDIESSLCVCDKAVKIEAAAKTVTDGKFFGSAFSGWTVDGAAFDASVTGGHSVTLTRRGKMMSLGVTVRDTTAPTATGLTLDCCTGYSHEPEEFISQLKDANPVTVEFAEAPDWNESGEKPLEIVLTDSSGNTSRIAAKAVVAPDTEAPVIYGVRDHRYCYIGDAVAYFKETGVGDNADPEPTLTVDKSAVDPRTPGEYTVTYTAADRDGNVSSVDVRFIFREKTVSDEELDALADKVLSEICTDEMSLPEKIHAVYEYVYGHVLYNGVSDKTDWKAEAYRGITEGVGDCFTFYSVSYLLLGKIPGCELLSVERLNGATRHYWCLLNIGTGWYHFDTCNAGPKYKAFMKTDAQLEQISTYFWRYDKSLYPAVATEPFEMK